MGEMKTCYKCKAEKPVVAFSKDRRAPDGLCRRCKDCRRAHYEADKPAVALAYAVWKKKNHAQVKARGLEYYYKNSAKRSEMMSLWYQKNKERVTLNVKKYRDVRPGYGAAARARRRSAQMEATPKWADQNKMRAFYELLPLVFAETGVKHHVDHVVPLMSKKVCGLHCEANLRVIPATENISKSNRYWPDMIA